MLFPMFGFALLAFLLLAVLLVLAVWFATRGAADPARTRLSGPAGIAIGCAVLLVAAFGALATIVVVLVNLPGEIARRGPISRIELRYAEEEPARATDGPAREAGPRIRAEIELRPGVEAGPVVAVLRRKIASDLDLDVRTIEREGARRTVIAVDGRLDARARRELADVLRDLREDLPGLDLPAGIVVEVRGPDDGS